VEGHRRRVRDERADEHRRRPRIGRGGGARGRGGAGGLRSRGRA
jgi:hypothetical protein